MTYLTPPAIIIQRPVDAIHGNQIAGAADQENREMTKKRHGPIPSENECYELMHSSGMLENIFRHSVQVMRVSMALAGALREPALIDADLVQAGALLHDIAKTRTIHTGEMRHDLIGGRIMRDLGFEDVARIVESHVFFDGFEPRGPLEEREIVFYADKRVMHDRIVSLDDRVDDLVNRYGSTQRIVDLIIENKQFVLDLERKLQTHLSAAIEEILSGLQ